ncbi:MAG: copper chaperone CopZ [Clostridiales Family XIII bacterium]|jgi:copper chaperone|nr:copper chaperone CopZ [Clostridiales Family XIII bacterium]
MATSIIKVEGMSCEHCVNAVSGAVSAVDGVDSVDVDLAAGTATVTYDPDKTTLAQIGSEIEDQGFDVVA